MKRILITIVGTLVAVASLMAQDTPAPENKKEKPGTRQDRAREMTGKLKQELDLTDEQTERLCAIHSKYGEERKMLRDEGKAQRDQQQTQMRDLALRQRDEIKTVLTEEQLARFDALALERSQRRKERPHRHTHRRH